MTEELPPLFAYLEAALGEARGAWLVGHSPSVADLAVASPFQNFRHTGTPIDAQTYPKLSSYVDGLLRHPTIADMFAAEVAEFGGNSPDAGGGA